MTNKSSTSNSVQPGFLPVRGRADPFKVNRVFCIGRNYLAHAKEMGQSKIGPEPICFLKPQNSVVLARGRVEYPPRTERLEHEVELIVALSSGGHELDQHQAEKCIFAYGVGVDLTRRDLQAEAKKNGHPWSTAKVFKASAPCSELIPTDGDFLPETGALRLFVNDALQQEGDISQMIWSVGELIAVLSTYFELEAGDIIMTGTPEGVGPIMTGDIIDIEFEDLIHAQFAIG